MSDLEKLKKTFDELGVPYFIEQCGDYVNLLISSRKSILFEFHKGIMVSCP